MANTATLVGTTPRNKNSGPVHSYLINIDTTSADLTIRTPLTGNRIFLVGALISDGTANNITFKSGSTVLCTPEFGANQGLLAPVGANGADSWILATAEDQALVINCSALLTSALLHVVEAQVL
jgi:hypothetical protein